MYWIYQPAFWNILALLAPAAFLVTIDPYATQKIQIINRILAVFTFLAFSEFGSIATGNKDLDITNGVIGAVMYVGALETFWQLYHRFISKKISQGTPTGMVSTLLITSVLPITIFPIIIILGLIFSH